MNAPLPDSIQRLTRTFDRAAVAYGRTEDAAAGSHLLRLLPKLEELREARALPLGWHGPEARMWALPCRDSWLRTRKLLGTVGGSDVGPIVYGAYDGLWGFSQPQHRQVNSSMSEGHWWESTILRRYAHQTGARLVKLPEHTIHLRWGWAHVSVDALAEAGDGRRGRTVVDAKWVFRVDQEDSREAYDLDHHVWGKSGDVDPAAHPCDLPLPPYILGQSVLLMAVLDLPSCDIAALLPRYDLRVYTVWRNPSRERALLRLCHDAWQRYRVDGEVPPADQTDVCLRWYAEQRRRNDRLKCEATPEQIAAVEALDQARAARKAAEASEKKARAHLVHLMGKHYRLEVDGRVLATADSRGSVRTY